MGNDLASLIHMISRFTSPMLETALTAFTTFFAVIGPINSAVLLATLTPNATRAERRAISLKAVFIATLIVLVFALFGRPILNQLGVSLPALQVAGGIILLMIALEMTLSKRPPPTSYRPRRARRPKARPTTTPRSPSFRWRRRCSRDPAP